MLEYMILPFKRYAEFTGRSRRMEFWMFALLNVTVYVVLFVITIGSGASLTTLESADPNDPFAPVAFLFGGAGILILIWWLVILVPTIAVSVRRLHDRDMSGWWYLGFIIASFIPYIGFVAGIAFLVIMLLPGTPGPNRFGPDPKDPTSAEVFS